MGGKDQAMPFDSYRDARRKHGNLESEPECGARHGSDDNTCYLLSEQRYGNVHAKFYITKMWYLRQYTNTPRGRHDIRGPDECSIWSPTI